MWTPPPWVALLVSSTALALACGSQSDVAGSVGAPSDAGAVPDVTVPSFEATQDAGADSHVIAPVDAAAVVDCGAGPGAPDAGACKIPAAASSGEAGASCQALMPVPGSVWNDFPSGPGLCGSSFYVMSCSARATPDPSTGCFGFAIDLDGGTSYCCPCEGVSACVDVDLSTYDHSCRRDSDCVGVFGGRLCAGSCACGANAAINVDGQCRYQSQYQQAFATVPPISFQCNGCPPDAPAALCIQGVCMYCPRGHFGDVNGCRP